VRANAASRLLSRRAPIGKALPALGKTLRARARPSKDSGRGPRAPSSSSEIVARPTGSSRKRSSGTGTARSPCSMENAPTEDAFERLERAERWLRERPGEAELLLTLGRLCVQRELWGKAQSLPRRKPRTQPTQAAHVALAPAFRARRGESKKSQPAFSRERQPRVGTAGLSARAVRLKCQAGELLLRIARARGNPGRKRFASRAISAAFKDTPAAAAFLSNSHAVSVPGIGTTSALERAPTRAPPARVSPCGRRRSIRAVAAARRCVGDCPDWKRDDRDADPWLERVSADRGR